MSNDLNVVALTCRLTRDPELRSTAGGTSVASLRVAFTTGMKDQSGAWVDQSNYADVVVWGNQADVAAQYLSKGRRIAIHGELRFSEWEAKDGSGKRSKLEVHAQRVVFLDYKEDSDGGSGSGGGGDDFGTPGADKPGEVPVPSDDIPF